MVYSEYRDIEHLLTHKIMIENCEGEVLELHRFFEEWLNGTVPITDEKLMREYQVIGYVASNRSFLVLVK